MPDYAVEIEFAAPEFPAPEFRMLRRQLVPLLQDSEGVTHVHADRSTRVVTAAIEVSAPSSSTAVAKAGATARALQARLHKVRAAKIALRVEVVADERAHAVRDAAPRALVER